MFYMYSNAVRIVYDTINSVYLMSRYPMDEYVTILFGTPWNIYGEEWEALDIVVYLEQLIFGNKRLAAFANMIMMAAMMLHPITFAVSFYWVAQLPFNAILEFLIYPIFPQFDTPQIPW